jgi:hypothetical protein
MTTRLHHVANGSSTTGLLARAGVPGTTSIWADPLHDGPVPAGLDDAELMAVRAQHLAESTGASLAEVTAELESWRSALRGREWDELVLWYEHDLFDQLNLIQLLDRIDSEGASATRDRPITLICIDRFPGRPSFRGLGELTPEELGSLLGARRPVAPAQLELARRAWSAFRAPDPREIERLLESDTSALPFLAAALRRHLEELPWTRDGLSRTERRVLDLAREAPIDIWTAFRRVSDGETAFSIADLSFRHVIDGLRSTTPALIDARAAFESDVALPRGAIELNEVGRAVLDGKRDRVALCGIDRWVGGAHLEGRGPIWRWDAEARHVVRC